MKEPISSSFHKATYIKFSTRKTTAEMKVVIDLSKRLLKFIGEFFSKQLLQSALQKEQ